MLLCLVSLCLMVFCMSLVSMSDKVVVFLVCSCLKCFLCCVCIVLLGWVIFMSVESLCVVILLKLIVLL